MKSLLCSLTLIAALSLLASPASADMYFFSDYNYIETSNHSLNGFDSGIGFGFGEHFGTEIGYIYADESGASANGGFLDLAYHFPLGNQSKFSLFATAGGEYVDAVSAGWGIRGGGGIEYWLQKGFAIRVGARYQSAIDDGLLLNAGFIARF